MKFGSPSTHALFVNCPVGQDFFKQSTIYLHYIVNCVFLTLLVYNVPIQCVDDVQGLVGYGIPRLAYGGAGLFREPRGQSY